MSSSSNDDEMEALAEAADGFFLAAEHGRSDVLKALADHAQGKLDLSRIVDPATGRTPLHVAVANGKTDAVRVLLAAGFPPDHESLPAAPTSSSSSNAAGLRASPDKRANTAYLLAKQLRATDLVFVFHQFAIQQIAANNVAGVEQMLRAGIDVDTTDGAARNTFVHWAVTCSASDVLACLLERNDVQQARVMDRVNADGATPLHLACRANNAECTRLLLRFGADPTVKGERGAYLNKTSLELATAPEVAALFTKEAVTAPLLRSDSDSSSRQSASEHIPSPGDASVDSAASASAGAGSEAAAGDSPSTPAVETRRPSHSDKDASSARLLLQLEEKDVLIAQLRKTIETLVVEAQEIRKLGDERVVLDYVRKLREENAVLQRDLDDAHEHIRIQQEQLAELKTEMRTLVRAAGSGSTHASSELLERDSESADAPAARQWPLHSSPLRLGASETRESAPPSTSSASDAAAWGSVLGGLWPFRASDDGQDVDGEVIMTV